MLSTKHKFIFIHIPKTGGNSIHNALRPFSEDKVVCRSDIQDGIERFETIHGSYTLSKHSTLSDYARELSNVALSEFKIFTCIRNPWERMISYYFSPHRRAESWSRESFLSMLENEVKSSAHYLLNDAGLLLNRVNFIRFESLQREFQELCRELCLPEVPLPHYNKSRHGNYRTYYDEELINRVEQKSTLEVNTFGYRF